MPNSQLAESADVKHQDALGAGRSCDSSETRPSLRLACTHITLDLRAADARGSSGVSTNQRTHPVTEQELISVSSAVAPQICLLLPKLSYSSSTPDYL